MRNLVMALVLGCFGGAWSADEPATVPPVKGEPSPPEDGTEPDAALFDKKGKLNRTAYLRFALDGSAHNVDRRLGPDADSLDKAAKASAKPKPATKPAGSKKKNAESEDDVTAIWLPPEQRCPAARNGAGMPFTVGGPPAKDGGDYSSTHAQVLYVPDKGGDPGVDCISLFDMAHNVFTCKPEPT
ncbi:MAG TPA: hypothetical protein VHX44_01225, partial [Planctomycetota bacterium]|nr:hypothetical protein [Planctomycetota bacterium]